MEKIMPIYNRNDFMRFIENCYVGAIVYDLPYYDYLYFIENARKGRIEKTLIILDGFGNYSENNEFAELCAQMIGKIAYLSPHTRVRAGIERPFIYF